ncbi:1-acyl-sn-glycerol-3-phosphate acyltransferase [Thalassotalea sp. PLHSN55]|uniref:1-acyl-sn-glycerol-3-phosphate acyltransferase n=1 Tax=Thalassotalea sp. PLHSN55 TaxID=3435888 RepID=UPI003F840EA7
MFDDIRPFRNDEVSQVIEELINEKELQFSLASFVLPKLSKVFPKLSCFLIKQYLRYQQKHLVNIEKIQLEVSKYLSRLVNDSTNGFSFHGIENVAQNKPALFISNHRDIVLDVALVNLALHQSGRETVEAAVGDNLLSKKWVADLMRINRSFIVKRSEETKRAMLKASKDLSAYIHHTITENNHNIWIAQREGRAKDGLDLTNPALISMLLLNKPKQRSIAEYLDEINIIPVSISYEFDPCDTDKAIELATREATGNYEKGDEEDLRSIRQGMMGYKGKVHLEFSAPIKGDYESSKEIASAIDQQIIANYKLYPSNINAHAKLTNQAVDLPVFKDLAKRMHDLNELQQKWFLTMYANPVIAKESLNSK